MIPAELITFGVSFIARAIQQHMAQAQADRTEERQFALKVAGLQAKASKEARGKINNAIFSWTASILAVVAFIAIIVLPKILFFIDPGASVSLGYQEVKEGFSLLGLIQIVPSGVDMEFETVKSLLITPMDTHLISAIAGCFFGGLNIKRR